MTPTNLHSGELEFVHESGETGKFIEMSKGAFLEAPSAPPPELLSPHSIIEVTHHTKPYDADRRHLYRRLPGCRDWMLRRAEDPQGHCHLGTSPLYHMCSMRYAWCVSV